MKRICLNYHNLGFSPQIGINKVHPAIFNNHIRVINHYIQNNPDTLIDVTFDDAYEDIYHFSVETLNSSLVSKKIIFPISEYIGKANSWDFTFVFNKYMHLNAKKIKTLSDSGWIVGSHGKTHQSLELMTSKEASIELKESKDSIEQIVGREVDSFAPPFGVISQRVYDLCVESGYSSIYIQKYKSIKKAKGVELVKRHNIYSIDRNRNILSKIDGSDWESRRENFISSFNNLTVFLKKITRK